MDYRVLLHEISRVVFCLCLFRAELHILFVCLFGARRGTLPRVCVYFVLPVFWGQLCVAGIHVKYDTPARLKRYSRW